MIELQDIKRRLASIAVLIIAVLLTGTFGYHFVSGWSLFDSLYMTVITLATVGYGEVNPLDHAGRIFTMFLIMGGIGVMTYAFSAITSVIVEGHLSAAFRRRRMEKKIVQLSGHYIVCGAGRAGGVIAAELIRTQRPFVLVERQTELVHRLRERLGGGEILHVIGDATEDAVLKAAGVERASGVFATLATDQDNAFVTLSAKGLNPRLRVVCCQKELGVREKLFRSGADNVVNPEYIGGLRMASEMIRPATVGFLDAMMRENETVERFEEITVPDGSPYAGKPVGEVKGCEDKGPLLVAVLDSQTKKYDINPSAGRLLRAGDQLVMVGEVGRLAELRRRFGAGA
jgi:voltage-gated potassium channel